MLENNFSFLRRISTFLGVCFYSFVLPFPIYPYTQEWECKEKNSYSISGVEFFKNGKIKATPRKFIEEKVRNLKNFEVFYDKKVGGIINGKTFSAMIGNLEEKGESSFSVNSKINADNELIEEKSIGFDKNTEVPITFYSNFSDLEVTTKQNTGFFNQNLETKDSTSTDKEFFTIENIRSSTTTEFSLLKISTIGEFNSIIDSNENETFTGDSSDLIQLSQGKCVVKSKIIN